MSLAFKINIKINKETYATHSDKKNIHTEPSIISLTILNNTRIKFILVSTELTNAFSKCHFLYVSGGNEP